MFPMVVMWRGVRRWRELFDRQETFTAAPNANSGGWCSKLTKTAGSPTSLCVSGVGAKLSCDATSETQVLTLYQGDVLPIPLATLHTFDCIVEPGSLGSHTTARWGIAEAENDTPGSVGGYAWFGLNTASQTAIICESSDGTNINTAIATGVSLTGGLMHFLIDFTFGLTDVRFYINGQRVAPLTTFNMSAAASTQYVQPYFQIGKTSTDAPNLIIRETESIYAYAYGS